jgi:hypothetical protein
MPFQKHVIIICITKHVHQQQQKRQQQQLTLYNKNDLGREEEMVGERPMAENSQKFRHSNFFSHILNFYNFYFENANTVREFKLS